MDIPQPPPNVSAFARDWGTIFVGFVSGVGATFLMVGRAMAQWVKRQDQRYIKRFEEVEARTDALEVINHEAELKLTTLQALSDQIKDQGRRLDDQNRRIDEGFRSINETLSRRGRWGV